MVTERQILHWLEEVKDPEIPVLSLVDLGVIREVEIINQDEIKVFMTPTFTGCPAMDVMKQDVEQVLQSHGINNPKAIMTFEEQWNSTMISEKGRESLKKFGLAPPPKHSVIVDIDILENVICPWCESSDTELKSPFGPTLCRSIHYCNHCKQAFEQFKPVE